MAIVDQYTIRARNEKAADKVKTCLGKIGLDVISTNKSSSGMMVVIAAGNNDMTPSQLELRLRELGCTMFSVKDQFADVSGNVPNVNPQITNTPTVPGVGHDPMDFDVELVNMTLDKMSDRLNSAVAAGDAMIDKEMQRSPEKQNYYEYMNSLTDELITEYGISEKEAIDAIYATAANYEAEGFLPPMPEGDDMTSRDYTAWVAAAKSLSFLSLVAQSLS